MAKFRQFLAKPVVTIILFALALGLLSTGTIGGARAVLSEFSSVYESQVSTREIGVTLLENGKAVSGSKAMLKDFLGDDPQLLPGKRYTETLAVSNSGRIDQFVRVTVQAYWLDPDGNKAPEMDSKWIKLGFVTNNGWKIDASAQTEERTVLYYGSVLPVGRTSTPFLDSVTVDGKVAKMVHQTSVTEDGLTTITTTFDYDGYQLCLCASVDAIQTHNAQEAIKSAWGRNVTVSGDTLSIG